MTEPPLRIVRGDATPEEIAALVVALAGAAGTPAADAPSRRSRWSDPAARMRQPPARGPGRWRSAYLRF